MCVGLYIYPLWTSENLKSGFKDVLLVVDIIYGLLEELRLTDTDEENCAFARVPEEMIRVSTASRPAAALKEYGDTLSAS